MNIINYYLNRYNFGLNQSDRNFRCDEFGGYTFFKSGKYHYVFVVYNFKVTIKRSPIFYDNINSYDTCLITNELYNIVSYIILNYIGFFTPCCFIDRTNNSSFYYYLQQDKIFKFVSKLKKIEVIDLEEKIICRMDM